MMTPSKRVWLKLCVPKKNLLIPPLICDHCSSMDHNIQMIDMTIVDEYNCSSSRNRSTSFLLIFFRGRTTGIKHTHTETNHCISIYIYYGSIMKVEKTTTTTTTTRRQLTKKCYVQDIKRNKLIKKIVAVF